MSKGRLIDFIKVDVYRCFSGVKWWVSIVAICLVILIPGWRDTDYPRHALETLFFGVYTSYFYLSLIISAFPFAASLAEDREHKYYREVILRGKAHLYVLSKMLVSFFSAFSTMFLGMCVVIVCLKLKLSFQPMTEFLESCNLPFHFLYEEHHYLLFFSLLFTKYGLFAGVCVQTSLLVSLFINNKLIIYFTPLLLFYLNIYTEPLVPFLLPQIYLLHYTPFIENDVSSFLCAIVVSIVLFLVFFYLIQTRFKQVITND